METLDRAPRIRRIRVGDPLIVWDSIVHHRITYIQTLIINIVICRRLHYRNVTAHLRHVYTDPEMFWIIKHGIRNTAMLAWGNLLSDDEIWQVVTLLREFNSLPDSVTLELVGHHH